MGLRHDQERQPERGVDRDDGYADDRERGVFRLRPAGEFMGGVRGSGNYRLVLESVPANLEGRHQTALRFEG